ncbi:hypothetical protein GFK82_00492 [Candidatus Steffania adelgidicola]|nr:hypothetical protein GFK82_00492 [Candidatus Steffania adelgidicola]
MFCIALNDFLQLYRLALYIKRCIQVHLISLHLPTAPLIERDAEYRLKQ